MQEDKTNIPEDRGCQENLPDDKKETAPRVKTVAGHIISDSSQEEKTQKNKPNSVLDVDEHMTEKEKLSLMTQKQKREYLLEYYGPKTLYVLIVLTVLVFLVVKFFTSDTASLNVYAVNTANTETAASDQSAYEEFLKENGYDPDKEYVNVSSGIGVSPDPNDEMNEQSMQLIRNRFMTNSVDVFFSDEDLVISLGEFGYLQNLDGVLTDDLKEKYKDKFVYVKIIDTGETIPVGIEMDDNEWLEDTGWYSGGAAMAFGENAKNMDLAIKFLEYISD